MKGSWKQEVVIGVLAGVVFLIVFLIGGRLLISLLCGLAALLCGRFLFGKKEEPDIRLILENVDEAGITQRQDVIKKYHLELEKSLESIVDSEMKERLIKIIQSSRKISAEAKTNGNDEKIINDLASFYLPSLIKILGEYQVVSRNNINSPKFIHFQQEVKEFLEELHGSFDKQLEALLTDSIYDAKLEMAHVKNILKSDGFFENQDFILRGDNDDEK